MYHVEAKFSGTGMAWDLNTSEEVDALIAKLANQGIIMVTVRELTA